MTSPPPFALRASPPPFPPPHPRTSQPPSFTDDPNTTPRRSPLRSPNRSPHYSPTASPPRPISDYHPAFPDLTLTPADDVENVEAEVAAIEEKKAVNDDGASTRGSSGKKKKLRKEGGSQQSDEEEKLIHHSAHPASDISIEMSSLAPPSSSPRPPPQPPPAESRSGAAGHRRIVTPSSALSSLKTMMLDPSAESEFNEEKAEMLDYEASDDLQSMSAPPPSKWDDRVHTVLTSTLRIFVAVLVGVCIGGMGYCISYLVSELMKSNLSTLQSLFTSDLPITAFAATLVFSLALGLFASLTVTFGSWHVKGSGVGKLNAFLSGVSSARSLTLRTLLFKSVGLMCSVGSGIKQGMEGPFIHLGAMMGLHVTHFALFFLRILASMLPPFLSAPALRALQSISGVSDERSFISAGSAAGFSVAFNAPIAGILYAMDGASAYWNGDYTFRSFICTMIAVVTLNILYMQGGVMPSRGLIDLEDQPPTQIHVKEFYSFFVLGVLGGLAGALFTWLNLQCEKRRLLYLGHRRFLRVLDAMVCSAATVLLSFALPFLFTCQPPSDQCTQHPLRCVRFQCGPSQYSDMATLFFTLPEELIHLLFDRTTVTDASVSTATLSVFSIVYFLMSSLSYGMAVPGGLFIPSIVIGGSGGRILGSLFASMSPAGVNPGVYAVLGASAMLGGVTRMTLPISVMMIEITSDAQFLIPIMLVVLVAKATADLCIKPLYAEHLRMDGLVMVFGDRLPRSLRRMRARDMMSRGGVVKVSGMERVDRVESLLRETTHNAFPVVDVPLGVRRRKEAVMQRSVSDVREGEEAVAAAGFGGVGGAVYLGLIQRRHLLYSLQRQIFVTPEQAADAASGGREGRSRDVSVSARPAGFSPSFSALSAQSVSSWLSFPFSSRPPQMSPPLSASTSPDASSAYVNLHAYIDGGAYMVSEETTARRVWSLFRSLGMRHIVVVDTRHLPVGMITRRDLIMHAVADS